MPLDYRYSRSTLTQIEIIGAERSHAIEARGRGPQMGARTEVVVDRTLRWRN